MLTFEELKERLAERFDEVTICELLNITPVELVEAFQDKIEARFTALCREVEDD